MASHHIAVPCNAINVLFSDFGNLSACAWRVRVENRSRLDAGNPHNGSEVPESFVSISDHAGTFSVLIRTLRTGYTKSHSGYTKSFAYFPRNSPDFFHDFLSLISEFFQLFTIFRHRDTKKTAVCWRWTVSMQTIFSHQETRLL